MKLIPGYDGRYSITRGGRVYSHISNRFLRASPNSCGYLRVCLSQASATGRSTRYLSVHRLVAQAYLDPKTSGCSEINHIDRDKTNNQASNLEWVSRRENLQHFYDNSDRDGFKQTVDQLIDAGIDADFARYAKS